jgi:hypothetical protein
MTVLELDNQDIESIDGNDYVLKGRSCWIKVENVAIYIRRTDEAVLVELYPNGDEGTDELDSMAVYFSEVKEGDES